MRIIVFTGKGGSGVSTLAAGTAALAAAGGRRTLAFGLGPGLGALYQVSLGGEETRVAEPLYALEAHSSGAGHTELRDWLEDLLDWRGLDLSLAEDLAAMPGLSHVGRLLELARYADGGGYDVVVVDGASQEQFLDLPGALDAAARWLEHLFAPRQQTVFDPFLRVFAGDYASAGEEVLDRGRDLLGRLARLRELLLDAQTSSVRLVLPADEAAVEDARRAIAALSLYSYKVDALVLNRLLPGDVQEPFFAPAATAQAALVSELEGASPVPVFRGTLAASPPRGAAALAALAQAIYGEAGALDVLHKPQGHSFTREAETYVMTLSLPFARREDLHVEEVDDGVAVQLNGRRCLFPLPDEVRHRQAASWSFEDTVLRITFPR